MAAQGSKSPELVRVQQAPKLREKIKRATKRHELVEVEDFVYRRKRKAVAPSPAAAVPAQPSSTPAAAAIRQGLQLDAHSPAAATAEATVAVQGDDDALMTDQAAQEETATSAVEESPAAEPTAEVVAPEPDAHDQQQQPEQDQEPDAAAEQEVHLAAADAAAETPTAPAAAQPAQPAQFSVAPSELCDLVEWVFLNERKKLPGTTADAARAAAAQFRQAFNEQLQQHAAAKAAGPEGADAGEGQQGQGDAAGGAAAAAPQLTVLPYLVEQQKAALQDKRAKLLQEEAHWLQLQQQYNDMHTTAAGAADADAAGADGVARVAAAAAAEAADSAGVAAAEPGAADKEAATAAAAGTGEAAAVAAAGGDGPVCAQQEAKVRGVQLKVEMLLALVSKMEHLVGSAETAARTLQAGYHAEKFKVFPHINSPAALIKSIISSQHATEGPGAGAGPSSSN